jgi:hypothetical protein
MGALPSPADVAARLAERGTPVASAAAGLDALEPQWGASPELEAGAAAWVGAEGDQTTGDRLHALEARTTAKTVKKEIRRALYRLAQRGAWTAPAAPPPPTARALLGPDDAEPEAWLTEIDPTGVRLLWMARRSSEGVTSLSAVVSDLRGLIEFHAGETTRKALRQAHRDLLQRSGLALVEAPWRHVDALLAQAYEMSDHRRFAEVPRARRVIAPKRGDAPVPAPVDALVDRTAAAGDAGALQASAEALHAGKSPGWLLPAEWLTPVLEKMDEARTSIVLVSPVHQEERVQEAMTAGLEQVFADPERRRLFARRFEETAYVLARRGDLPRARALVAAAVATEGGRSIAGIPALVEIARVSMAFALEARAEQAQEEAKSSLVVTPAQALAEQRARTRRR